MTAAFVAPESVRRGADAMMYLNVLRRGRSHLPPRERLGDGEPRMKGVRECQRPSWPPSPSEGARRDDVARQPPARSKPPPAAGTARRRRTAYEGCSGMTSAFVAPSPSEGARTR